MKETIQKLQDDIALLNSLKDQANKSSDTLASRAKASRYVPSIISKSLEKIKKSAPASEEQLSAEDITKKLEQINGPRITNILNNFNKLKIESKTPQNTVESDKIRVLMGRDIQILIDELTQKTKDAQGQLDVIEKDKAIESAKVAKIQKNKVDRKRSLQETTNTIVEILPNVLGIINSIVLDPHAINLQGDMVRDSNNVPSATKTFVKIFRDENLKFSKLAVGAVKNIKNLVKVGFRLPGLIQDELDSNGNDRNKIIQSEFLTSLLKNENLFKKLSDKPGDIGDILWSFQNDIAQAIQDRINKSSTEKNPNKILISAESILILVSNIINNKNQLESIVKIVRGNEANLVKMFSDEKSAYYKLAKSYGINPGVIHKLLPQIISLIDKLPNQHDQVVKVLEQAESYAASPTPENIFNLVSTASGLLKDPEIAKAADVLLSAANVKDVVDVIAQVASLGGGVPKPYVDLLQNEGIKTLISKVASNDLVAKLPQLSEMINEPDNKKIITKLFETSKINNQLTNKDLPPEKKRELFKLLHDNQLDPREVAQLAHMGIEAVKTLGVSSFLGTNSETLKGALKQPIVMDAIKSQLPQSLKLAGNSTLIPGTLDFVVDTLALFTEDDNITKLQNTLPENIDIILGRIDKFQTERSSMGQFIGAAQEIASAISKIISGKEFAENYQKFLEEVIDKNEDNIKSLIDSFIESNPELKKFGITSEDVTGVLKNEKTFQKLGAAFDELAEKKYLRAGFYAAQSLAATSGNVRIIIMKVALDNLMNYFKNNIVPDFIKRLMSGADLNIVISNAAKEVENLLQKKTDGSPQKYILSQACRGAGDGNYSAMSNYLIQTKNFAGQRIFSSLDNMEINGFNFKNTVLNVKEISNVDFYSTNLALNIADGHEIKLNNVSIDLKTLDSMVGLINSGKIVVGEAVTLSENPQSKNAEAVLNKLENDTLKTLLKNNCELKRPTQTHKETLAAQLASNPNKQWSK